MNTSGRTMYWIAAGLIILGSLGCFASDVVINEIAWSGTAASSSDEWIELYNPTDRAVDLTGWVLTFGETVINLGAIGDGTIEVRRTTIEAGGFFLLERTDDETVSDIEADLLYKGALSNNGVALELRNPAGELVDRVDPVEQGWPAGAAADGETPYASMERVDPLGEATAWVTHDSRFRNGLDADEQPLNGTPGFENSSLIVARFVPRVELVSPIEEGAVLSGIVFIEWTAADPDGPDEGLQISIELSLDDGETWELLVANLANGGSYAWETNLHPDREDVFVRVIAEDADGYRGAAASPAVTVRNRSD